MNTSTKKPSSVLILGPYSAGKKTIIHMAKYGENIDMIPTVGIDFEKLTINDDHLFIWKIGGRSAYRPLWNMYYGRMLGFIFVFDCSNYENIEDVKMQLHQLSNDENARGKPILIFANKQDLPDAMNMEQLKDKLDLENLNKNIVWHIQKVSARENQGLQPGFEWLVASIRKKLEPIDPVVETLNDAVTMKNDFISKLGIDKLTAFARKYFSLSFSYFLK